MVVMDTEAVLEHLGRSTDGTMDPFIVVVEPRARSIQTCEKARQLAKGIGITHVRMVMNKVRDEQDETFLRCRIPEDALPGLIYYSSDVIDEDRGGLFPPATSVPPPSIRSGPSRRE